MDPKPGRPVRSVVLALPLLLSLGAAFQDDIFPPAFSGVASLTADDWVAGESKPPMVMDLNPDSSGAAPSASAVKFVAPKSSLQLAKELEAANKRIAELEKKLADAGISAD